MVMLRGIEEICNHARMSRDKILQLKREQGFPMKKDKTLDVWISDTELIDEWRKAWIANRNMEIPVVAQPDPNIMALGQLFLDFLKQKVKGLEEGVDVQGLIKQIKFDSTMNIYPDEQMAKESVKDNILPTTEPTKKKRGRKKKTS